MNLRSRSVLCAECFSSPARAGSLLPRRHLLVSPVSRGTADRPLGSPSGLLLHPLAMRLILGIDPDSHLQGGWQSASERLKNGPSGRRHTPQRTRLESTPGSALWQVSRGDRGPDSGAREGGTQACHGEVRSANWTPGRHAERHVSPRGSSTVSGYGSVDPGSADRWRNTKRTSFSLALWCTLVRLSQTPPHH